MRRRTLRITTLPALAALLIGACGDSADDAGQDVATTAMTAATTTTTAGAPADDRHDNEEDDADQDDGEKLVASGVVVAVNGNLSGIDSFTIRLEDGSDLTFIPAPDALFDGGPFSHIRDHLVSGAPVAVEYVETEEGTLTSVSAGDA